MFKHRYHHHHIRLWSSFSLLITLHDGKTSEKLRKRLAVVSVSVSDKVRQGRLRWFGHEERRDEGDWVSACRDMSVVRERGRERGRKTWNECIVDDMKKRS